MNTDGEMVATSFDDALGFDRKTVVQQVVSQIWHNPMQPDDETRAEFNRHMLPKLNGKIGPKGVLCYWVQVRGTETECCTGYCNQDGVFLFGADARIRLTEVMGGTQQFEMVMTVFGSTVEQAVNKMVAGDEIQNYMGTFNVGTNV